MAACVFPAAEMRLDGTIAVAVPGVWNRAAVIPCIQIAPAQS